MKGILQSETLFLSMLHNDSQAYFYFKVTRDTYNTLYIIDEFPTFSKLSSQFLSLKCVYRSNYKSIASFHYQPTFEDTPLEFLPKIYSETLKIDTL